MSKRQINYLSLDDEIRNSTIKIKSNLNVFIEICKILIRTPSFQLTVSLGKAPISFQQDYLPKSIHPSCTATRRRGSRTEISWERNGTSAEWHHNPYATLPLDRPSFYYTRLFRMCSDFKGLLLCFGRVFDISMIKKCCKNRA